MSWFFYIAESIGSSLLYLGMMVLAVILAIFVSLFLAQTLRRVLGVPVGRVRTFIVSALLVFATPAITTQLYELTNTSYVIEDLGWFPALLFTIIVLLWLFALAAALLTVLEMIVPTGNITNPILWLTRWRSRARRNRRYRQVVAIFVKHGVSTNSPVDDDEVTGPVEERQSRARTALALCKALEESGITFVKLGQALSSREDLLPPEFTEEFSKLQSDVRPEKWRDIRKALNAELGADYRSVFGEVEEKPLAAASVAQVHRGKLKDGTAVVLKIQRPGAVEEVSRDADIVVRICKWLESTTGWGRRLGIGGLGVGFADSLLEELDYREEEASMMDLHDALDGSGVIVPRSFPDYSSTRLLVMEDIQGTPVGKESARRRLAELSDEARNDLATTLVSSVLTQVMDLGIFHADLHPGNVLLVEDGTARPALALLDFGSVGRIDKRSQRSLMMILVAVQQQDPQLFTDSFLELLGRPEGLDEHRLQQELGNLMVRYGGGLRPGQSAKSFGEMFTVVLSHGFSIPPAIAAALRTFVGLESTIALISPETDLVTLARESGSEMFTRQFEPKNLRDSATNLALEVMPALSTLPRQVNRLTRQLTEGQLGVNVRMLGNDSDRRFITWLVQQIVVAVLAGAFLLGGSVLIAFDGSDDSTIAGIGNATLVGYVVLFFGFMLSLRAVAMVMNRNHRFS